MDAAAGADSHACLKVPARVESSNVVEVLEQLTRACHAQPAQAAGGCVLDLSGLEHFDSTALSMLLELARRAGRPLRVLNPPDKLRELAGLYGVSGLLLDTPSTGAP